MQEVRETQATKPGAPLRRILVASDLTPYSDRAFDRAIVLAERDGTALRFVHAVDPTLIPAEQLRLDILEAQRQLEGEIRDSGIDRRTDVSVRVAASNAETLIVEEARAVQADLIVLGRSRDETLRGVFRGTTIDRVVRNAPCPVLAVKRRARRAYAKIAVAVDLAEASRCALDFALRVFPEAQFTILHVDEFGAPDRGRAGPTPPIAVERRHQVEDLVTARLAAAGRPAPGTDDGPELIIERGRALDVLLRQIARLSSDLVVLGTHGRTGMANLILGSVAEQLLEMLPNDVLVARA